MIKKIKMVLRFPLVVIYHLMAGILFPFKWLFLLIGIPSKSSQTKSSISSRLDTTLPRNVIAHATLVMCPPAKYLNLALQNEIVSFEDALAIGGKIVSSITWVGNKYPISFPLTYIDDSNGSSIKIAFELFVSVFGGESSKQIKYSASLHDLTEAGKIYTSIKTNSLYLTQNKMNFIGACPLPVIQSITSERPIVLIYFILKEGSAS